MIKKIKKKRILFDVTCLFDQYSSRGIGRYTKDMLKRLIKLMIETDQWEIHLLGFNDEDQNLISLGFSTFFIEEHSKDINFNSIGKPYNSSVQNIFKWKDLDSVIYEVEPDIYFAMHFERGLPTTKYLRHKFNKLKTVVTVHDIIPLVNNKFSNKNPFINFLKGQFYRFMWTGVDSADLIFTSSNFSKEDILTHTRVGKDNLEVVYLGINDEFYKEKIESIDEHKTQEVIERFGVKDKKYFFYDSGIEANKGIENLIQILKKLWEVEQGTVSNEQDTKGEMNVEYAGEKRIVGANTQIPDPKSPIPDHIVITGGDFYTGVGKNVAGRTELGKAYVKRFETEGILEHVITTSKISDQELQILLGNANSYIYLSEYEGFGFGPVQAMAAEVPAIVNNSSCLPEITSGGALIVDAKDHDKSVEDIKEFLADKTKVNEMIEKGKEVVQKYDWEKTAEEVLGHLETLAKE